MSHQFYKKFLFFFIFIISIQNIQSQNDCIDAIIVCGSTNYNGLSANGSGNQEELSGTNSCSGFENNSIWFKVNIQTAGTLGFTLTPQNVNIGIDFDFFVFGPVTDCNNLGSAIRCSTTNPENAGLANNHTGMNANENDVNEGPGPSGNSFVKWLDVLDNETYYIVVDRPIGNSNFSLSWTGSATFNQPPIFDNISSGTTLDLSQCDVDAIQDNKTLFDLTPNATIAIGNQTNIIATFHTNNNDVLTGENPIIDSTNYQNTSNPQQIYIRLTNPITGCFTTEQFLISVTPYDTPNPINLEECDLDNNGFVTFNLSQNDVILSNGNTNISITYHPSNNDIITLPNNYINQIAFTNEIIWAKIQDNTNGCYAYKAFSLIINTIPNVIANQLTQCDFELFPDGLTTFNLTEADPLITQNDSNLSTKYYLDITAALNDNGVLNSSFVNTTNPQTLGVRVTNNTTGCYSITTLTLNVNVNPTITVNLEACDDDGIEDGFFAFDLTDAGFETIGNTVTYYESQNSNDVLLEQNAISSDYINTQQSQQTIYARIENGNDCIGINIIHLIVHALPNIEIEDTAIFCLNKPSTPVKLDAGIITGDPNSFQYVWSPNSETTRTINVFSAGQYKVRVTNNFNCFKERTITVTNSDIATIKEVKIVDLSNNNTVTILINESIDQFNFSIDNPNGPFQESNFFENVESGIHTVYVEDREGCGIVSKEIAVLGIPKFFTPNGDGFNDTWKIIGLTSNFFNKSSIQIFDRSGKFVAQINANDNGWDGTANGKQLTATDYWYVLNIEDGRIIKGHFSLKR